MSDDKLPSVGSGPQRPEGVARYLDSAGRVIIYPSKRAMKLLVLAYLASKFEADREYSEREVNEVLQQYHTFSDWALLRRDLYDEGFLDRTMSGNRYWVTVSS